MIDLRNVLALLVVTFLVAGCGTRPQAMRESAQFTRFPILTQHFRSGEPQRAALFSERGLPAAQPSAAIDPPRLAGDRVAAIVADDPGGSAVGLATAVPDILSQPTPQVRVPRVDETPPPAPRDTGAPPPAAAPVRADRRPTPVQPPRAPRAAAAQADLRTDGAPTRVRRRDGSGYDVL